MLKTITWNQYFLFVGMVAALWYIFLFLKYSLRTAKKSTSIYLANDRSGLFGNGSLKREETSIEDAESTNVIQAAEAGNLIPELLDDDPALDNFSVETIAQELRSIISKCGDENLSHDELQAQLQVTLSNHINLKNTAYGSLIIDFILRETQAYGYTFSKDEIGGFWM